jgi:hypothetical protein
VRKKYLALVVCAAALLSATSVSVTGQQEPLPVVTPKLNPGAAPAIAIEPAAAVYLVSDPIREFKLPTLEQAARDNDYVTFDALYRSAKQRGEDVSRFATLHELWTWAITDPIGAFYGREMYARLADAYPGYASYIGQYAITDSNGNTFWPTSETRAFLLSRATLGDLPRTQLVERIVRPEPERSETIVRQEPKRSAATLRPAPKYSAKSAAVEAAPPATPPVVIQATEEETRAPQAATTPAPVQTQPAPVQTQPAPVAAVQEPAPATPAATTTTPAVTRRENSLASRGILLLVLGLIGVGLLAVIFRTPKEEDEVHDTPHANVEPIRKPAEPEAEKPRATGSHG